VGRGEAMIRKAQLDDLEALVTLETRCFATDRLSRRSFRHLLTRGNAVTLVDEDGDALRGYAMVLFHAGTALARLYSIAVDPDQQGRGIGRALLTAAEQEAIAHDCASMRSEVRKDNAPSIALFTGFGYRRFDDVDDYYEDGMGALRFERTLEPYLRPSLVSVPYYEQTLDFTCGAASLLMAMKALEPGVVLSRTAELRVWREATTIFMTSGHGGCGPWGLALAAVRRGFPVELFVKGGGVFLADSVRDPEKKEVMRLVEEDFVAELRRLGVPVYRRAVTAAELEERRRRGGVPVVLISSYRIYSERSPHWVVVTGLDDRFIYVHDPYVDVAEGRSRADTVNMPIPRREFGRMVRYGKAAHQAVLIVYGKPGATEAEGRCPSCS
jgi:ribosomal protein S18 acetylase RimI-like enzyme